MVPLIVKHKQEIPTMFYGLLDEALYRMLRTVGIEYAVMTHSTSKWGIEPLSDGRSVNIGRLEVIVSKVERRAAVVT
jgi:hypothetical protein